MHTLYRSLGILAILLLFGLGVHADSTVGHHEDETPNAFCPVMPDEPIDPDISVVYEGEEIFLCCKKCKRKFLADPQAYLPPSKPESNEASGYSHDEESGDEHDHASDHGTDDGPAKLLTYVGKFHPLAVHFPIALLLSAFLTEVVAAWRTLPILGKFARFLVVLGAASAVAAAGLGWLAAGAVNYPEEMAGVLWRHRWLGVSVAVISVFAAALSCLHRDRKAWVRAYRITLGCVAILVGLTGHLGATLIYGLDYFKW